MVLASFQVESSHILHGDLSSSICFGDIRVLWITARALDADPGDLPSCSNRSCVVFRAASSFASILKSVQAKNKCVLNALKMVC